MSSQVSSVFSLASSAPPRNGRILFRHGLSGTHFAPEVHDRLRRGLAEQHIKLGRNLLQAQNFSALQIVSLGKHVGVDMLEVPEEVAYDWVLEELKNHPGKSDVARHLCLLLPLWYCFSFAVIANTHTSCVQSSSSRFS